jgi:hypothetical protein
VDHVLNSIMRMGLQLLQQRFRAWIKPPSTSLLLGTVTDLARSKSELVAENALLRQQLIILRRQVKQAQFIIQEDDAPAVASSGMRACFGRINPDQLLPNQRYPLRPWR